MKFVPSKDTLQKLALVDSLQNEVTKSWVYLCGDQALGTYRV